MALEDTQKKYGTYKEQILQVQKEFLNIREAGDVTADHMESFCIRLLKSAETIRVNSDAQIRKLQSQIDQHASTMRFAGMWSNMLVTQLMFFRRDSMGVKGVSPKEEAEQAINKDSAEKDTEVLKRICICGCLDDEDASQCKCSCHKGEPCGQLNCVYCTSWANKILVEKEAEQEKLEKRKRGDAGKNDGKKAKSVKSHNGKDVKTEDGSALNTKTRKIPTPRRKRKIVKKDNIEGIN